MSLDVVVYRGKGLALKTITVPSTRGTKLGLLKIGQGIKYMMLAYLHLRTCLLDKVFRPSDRLLLLRVVTLMMSISRNVEYMVPVNFPKQALCFPGVLPSRGPH